MVSEKLQNAILMEIRGVLSEPREPVYYPGQLGRLSRIIKIIDEYDLTSSPEILNKIDDLLIEFNFYHEAAQFDKKYNI